MLAVFFDHKISSLTTNVLKMFYNTVKSSQKILSDKGLDWRCMFFRISVLNYSKIIISLGENTIRIFWSVLYATA